MGSVLEGRELRYFLNFWRYDEGLVDFEGGRFHKEEDAVAGAIYDEAELGTLLSVPPHFHQHLSRSRCRY